MSKTRTRKRRARKGDSGPVAGLGAEPVADPDPVADSTVEPVAGSWCSPAPGEDHLAFLAFRFYRDLWPTARSVETVALELCAGRDDITVETCRNWATRFSWGQRALEYDVWQDARTVARRDEVRRAREALADAEGWVGTCFLRAAQGAGERMAKDSADVSAQDAIRLARAARELLAYGGNRETRGQSMGALFDRLPEERLAVLLSILEEAGVDLDE